ncbi:transferrin-binding protein-like solute binding protein [Roseicitreum antarcticum]|uniref:Transferrin-binding protein B C-lobe/N-lobe beta-barrel domain-containing protein n=1 Tax=Roseicitreum antarcticum TaxID=564137 RepID=A0A1H3BU61_9RHOB|nr:transferrin-binding protein-like solute binding protein [Roseicitreum antarcticum]SDX44719.1 hypothetical protein SAMN04488238_108159 [Roseicitreum antarcticum]
MKINIAVIGLIGVTALGACGGGGGGGGGGIVTPGTPSPRDTLPVTGQGNSGGVLSRSGENPLAGVEATMAYAGNSGRSSGAHVDFHNGDMSGVGVRCSRAGGGAVVPSCDVSNARAAYLTNELSGSHSYAGTFVVEGYGPGGNQNGTVALHASPTGQGRDRVQLPSGGQTQYNGRFQAGGGLVEGGQMRNGTINGSIAMDVDFAQHSLDGTMTGTLYDATTTRYIPVAAGFADAVVGVDGTIYNGTDTTMTYGGQQASGQLDGAFYGPNAEEAAGSFGFGNELGGMTGIFVGCSANSGVNCVAPSPRF